MSLTGKTPYSAYRMTDGSLVHRYALVAPTGSGPLEPRRLLSCNDPLLLRAALSRLAAKGWRLRLWDERERRYIS